MPCLKSLLKRINFFAIPVSLKINGSNSHSSRFGEILSILIIIYVLTTIFQSDYFYKNHPKLVFQSIQQTETQDLYFSSKNFSLAVKLSDANSKGQIDPNVFKFQAIYNRLIDSQDGNGQKIVFTLITDMILCTPNHFENNIKHYDLYGFKNAYCLNRTFFETGGFWDESHVFFVKIQLVLCSNTSETNNCKTPQFIQEFMTYKFFDIYILNNEIDVNNFEKPIYSLINNYYMLVDPKIRKRWNFKIREVDFETTDGYIWPSRKLIKTFKHGDLSFDFDISYADKVLFEFLIYGDKKKDNYFRTYISLQEVLANIGGITQFLINFGYILYRYFLRKNMNEIISNSLFRFRFSNNKNKFEIKTANKKKNKKNKKNKCFNLKKHEKDLIHSERNSEKRAIQKLNNDSEIKNEQGLGISDLRKFSLELDKIHFHNKNELDSKKMEFSQRLKINTNISSSKNILESKKLNLTLTNGIKLNSNSSKNLLTESRKSPITPQLKGDIDNAELEKEINSNIIEKKESTNIMTDLLKSLTLKFTKKVKNNKNDSLAIRFKEYQGLKQKENSIYSSPFDLLKIKLFDKKETKYLKEKQKLLKKSNKQINTQLDIISILKKLQEIDKLKAILLTKEQIRLFDLLSNPLISIEGNEDILSNLISKNETMNDLTLKETVEYYKNASKSPVNTIDYKLHLLVDGDMKIFLEND